MTASLSAKDIVIRIRADRASRSSSRDTRQYHSLFYTALPISSGPREISDAEESWKELPLQASGIMRIPWQHYQEMLSDFYEGIKGVEKLSYKLRECFSREMQVFIDSIPVQSEVRRIWWGSQTPELDAMPWELLFNKPYMPPIRPSFVRGLPPETPPPILPLSGPLRLLWTDSPATPPWMRALFESGTLSGIETVRAEGGLDEAIRQAARESIELLHCATNGKLSLAYEGILFDHTGSEDVTAAGVADVLQGTRVSLIGLTPQMKTPGDADVYRAFASFSASRSLPSVVAPLGPTLEPVNFWKAFYERLGSSYHLDGALQAARAAAPASSCAAFVRHAQGKLFRPAGQRAFRNDPGQVAFGLNNASIAIQKIDALRGKFGAVPDYLQDFAEHEGKRRTELGAELADWSRLEEGEE